MPSVTARDGTLIHYDSYGSGKTILFVHGWGFSSNVWEKQVQEFSASHRVITIDLRGHGRSGDPKGDYSLDRLKEDLLTLIRNSGVKGIILVGWSMGASVAIKLMAEERPSEVDSLIIVAGTPMFTASYEKRGERIDIKRRNGLFKTLIRVIAGNIGEISKGKGNLSKRIRMLMDCRPWAGISTMTGYMKAMADTDLTGILHRIEVPALIIHGDRDILCPVDGAFYMADGIKGARLEILNGDDHTLCMTDPDRVNEKIRAFMSLAEL